MRAISLPATSLVALAALLAVAGCGGGEEIRSTQDSPEELVHDVIDEVVWGDQAIGRSIAGTEETVGGIERKAMVDFWQRNYGPGRLVIAAGGDVRHDEVVALSERYFGDLTEHPSPDETTDTVEDQSQARRRSGSGHSGRSR
jgi:predicted Zn-dependent peptidase